MSDNTLILFAKYPTPGRVKTRLAAEIGPERAAALYKEMVEHVVQNTMPPSDAATYSRILQFDPPEHAAEFRTWFPQLTKQHPQHGRDLGERMHNAFTECLSRYEARSTRHEARTCLIGTDCLTLTAADIVDAFAQLDRHDLVIGPTTDGGYYLIGMKQPMPALFAAIAWSTPTVYAQTRAIAERLHLRVAALRERRDIDTIGDLRA